MTGTEQTEAMAARTVSGHTIAWSRGEVFDFDNPDASTVTLEDYAFALACTVRWRAQTWFNGERCFYGVGQHCCIGTRDLMRAGHDAEVCRSFLFHESDEVPLPDMPKPAKVYMPEFSALAKRCGAALDRRFGITHPDPVLIKVQDIRMLVTEKRDLLPGHAANAFTTDGTTPTEGFEPLPDPIWPHPHPAVAAREFLQLASYLGVRNP